ncbi:sensor histidine kinase [Flavobacterium sp.]|uniref:sensor histidine kinase n=1 Tax=Flavobacterium sp. TaxID=239 RepID=UPI0026370073|nr:sensor histidine kinase [Flavobacterium sp.]
MKNNIFLVFNLDEMNLAIGSVFVAFLLMSFIVISFFYFSRKKIIQKEIEKKNLEINHQKELLRSVILTQEEERKRIAQDLHDDISSKLNVVSLNTHLLNTPNLSEEELLGITNNITDLTQKALESSRRIAHDLLPPVLEKFGLHAGIEELVAEFNTSKSVHVIYKNELRFNINEIDKQLHIFRILQELLNNSIRHGKASEISIEFKTINGKETCVYIDNGIGFDLKSEDCKKGLGMKNIESRINFLNGTFSIESNKNKGVQINFTF